MPRIAAPQVNAGFFDSDGSKHWLWEVLAGSPSSPTVANIGVTAPTTVGGGSSTVQDANGEWINYLTAEPSQNSAGWMQNASGPWNLIQTQWNPVLVMTVEFPNSTDFGPGNSVFSWCGWSSTTSVLSTDSPTSGYIAAFLQSSNKSNSDWYCVVNNGSTYTAIDSLVPIVAATRYKLKIDSLNPSSIGFWINGRLVAVASSNVPASNQGMGLVIATNTTNTTNKNIRISSAECRLSA